MRRFLWILTACMFLNACGSSRPSTFYVLDSNAMPPQSVTLKNADNIFIGIEPVFIPNYLDKPQIVIRNDDSVTLTMSEFNRWAEQLGDVFPRVLANAISEKAGYPAAKQINLNRDLFPYRLFVEVLRFDAAFNNEAVLDTWWTFMSNSGKIIYRTRSTLVAPVGGSYAEVVEAEQKLLKELGYTIADYALKNLKKGQK